MLLLNIMSPAVERTLSIKQRVIFSFVATRLKYPRSLSESAESTHSKLHVRHAKSYLVIR